MRKRRYGWTFSASLKSSVAMLVRQRMWHRSSLLERVEAMPPIISPIWVKQTVRAMHGSAFPLSFVSNAPLGQQSALAITIQLVLEKIPTNQPHQSSNSRANKKTYNPNVIDASRQFHWAGVSFYLETVLRRGNSMTGVKNSCLNEEQWVRRGLY